MIKKYAKLIAVVIYTLALISTFVIFIYKYQLGISLYIVLGFLHTIFIYKLKKDAPKYCNQPDPVVENIKASEIYTMIFIITELITWPLFVLNMFVGMYKSYKVYMKMKNKGEKK